MGRHVHSSSRSGGHFAWIRRGVAGWVWAVITTVILLVAATIGWFIVVGNTDSDQAGLCAKHLTVAVAAGPTASPAISDVAAAYNHSQTVVRSTCITIAVTTVADDVALDGLADTWPSTAGDFPALWIPDNAAASAALDAIQPVVTAGRPSDPFAWSPTVLATQQRDAAAISALSWGEIPDAAGADGTTMLSGGRHVVLALPQLTDNPATGYALQAMLLTAGPAGPVTDKQVTSQEATLTAVADSAADKTATRNAALTALADGSSDATVIPVVEANLTSFLSQNDDSPPGSSDSPRDDAVVAAYLEGATVGDSLIATPITNLAQTDRTRSAGASSFQAFLSDPGGQHIMANHGWRTANGDATDGALPGIDMTHTVDMAPAASPTVDVDLATLLDQIVPLPPPTPTTPPTTSSSPSETSETSEPPETPESSTTPAPETTTTPPTTTSQAPGASGPVLSLVVDSSSSMGTKVDDKSLMTWVQSGLDTVIDGTITDRIGLWAFSDSGFLPPNGYPQLVSTGKLDGTVEQDDTDKKITRSKALATSLDGLKAEGDRWAYGAIMEAVKSAKDSAVDGRESRIIVITSGVDETPGTPRADILKTIKDAQGDFRIDVLGLGSSVPVSAYTDIAKAGGGEYIPVTDPADIGQVISNLLTIEN